MKRVRVALATGAVLGAVAVVAWARTGDAAVAYAIGDGHDDAWAWWWQQRAPAHIAYTGSNLPLPLWGPHLEHRVRYVPIAGGLNSAPHQFLDVPPPGPLQTPSEPAPERRQPERSSWLANLDAFGADWLFVARMYPGVAAGNVHDDQDFPVERAWADGDPARFHLAYANEGARIYQIHRRSSGPPR